MAPRDQRQRRVLQPPVRAGKILAADVLGDLSVEISRRGVNARQEYRVHGLDGTTSVESLLQAIRAPGIPHLNRFSLELGSFVSSIRATYLSNSNTQAKVVVNWGPEDDTGGGFNNDPDDNNVLPLIQIDVTLQHVTTMFDVTGKLIVIVDYVEDDVTQPPQTGEVEIVIPMFAVLATRLERGSPGLVKSPLYSGTINADSVFGDPKHFWLAAVAGRSIDGGLTYHTTYTFQRNVETWNAVTVYRDPKTGRPGTDVTKPDDMEPGRKGNGSLVTQQYIARPFRGGALQLPDTFWGPRVIP